MKTFNILILKQSRIILTIFSAPAIIFILIFIGTRFNDLTIAYLVILSGLPVMIFLLYYFTKGRLIVTFENQILYFEWEKKYFFNYSSILPLKIIDIKGIVLDENKVLRKIMTNDREIYLGHALPNQYIKSDSQEFIGLLLSENKGLIIKDSWDAWHDKGHLKFMLWVCNIIFVAAYITFFYVLIYKEIKPKYFLLLSFILPQIALYLIQKRVKKKNTNSNNKV
ncbi:MAG: hypothetical protein AB8B74_08635 [Crocinitomicaceae bacterium]